MKFLLIFITIFFFAHSADLDWYKTASFYQIYPQTFKDGGGGSREGFGTFAGIKQKLDYIKDLGIDCIWLTPIFESSFNSFGYDITDYKEIDTRYGSKTDFQDLIKAIHDKGMKIIVDFVPNHCGYENKFFQLSLAKNATYENWFMWAKGKGANNEFPPSNWMRIGGPPGSGWNRHIRGVEIEREEYFYAQFSEHMPDFNLREPEVKKYFEAFLRDWLTFGLDGFRIDAISHGYEYVFPNGTYPDEPRNEAITEESNFAYLYHNYTQDQPELFDLIYRWREILDEFNNTARIMMTESYSSPETVMKFYRSADGQKEGAQLPFNFEMIRSIKKDSKAQDFVSIVTDWFKLLPEGKVTNWAIGNHDQSRVATRFGPERVDIFNTLVTMLPGTSVTYYGEEIGMEDSCVYYDPDRNKPGYRCTEDNQPKTDAKYRTPMQWDNSTNGGFTNSTPWLPIGDKYQTVNVAAQTGVAGSHLEIYRSLQKMRKHNAIKNSNLKNFKIVALTENSFGFKREIENVKQESVLVLINYGDRNESVTFEKLELFGSPKEISLKIVGRNSALKIDAKLAIDKGISLAPYESIVGIYNHGIATVVVSNILLIAMILVAGYFNL